MALGFLGALPSDGQEGRSSGRQKILKTHPSLNQPGVEARSEGGDGPCGSGSLEKKEGLEELGGMGEGEINRREPTLESLYPDSLKRPPNKRSTERRAEKKMSVLNNRHL